MTVFADTSYYVALLSVRDQFHLAALSLGPSIHSIITSQFIITELGATFSHPLMRPRFLKLYNRLMVDSSVQILAADANSFDAGMNLYRQRPDKNWSLVDCISFEMMKQHSLTDALTADHHFEQAGFNRLLK